MLIGKAQSSKQNYQLIGIEGSISNIIISQDDISFYTWSLYLTIDIVGGWGVYLDSVGVKKNIDLLEKYCDNFSMEKLKFNRNCFYDQKAIEQFTGNIQEGDKVKIFVSKSSFDEFLNGQKCQIKMESILKVK